MNFFGGSNCGNMDRGDFHGGNGGNDCCSLIFLLLLLQNCGCGGGMKDCELCIDLRTIILLALISNCGFGCGCNK